MDKALRNILVLYLALACSSLFGEAEADLWQWAENDQVKSKAGAVEISLRENAKVEGEQVFLSDIASCSGSEAICEEIHGVEISRAPDYQRTLVINQSEVLKKLALEWPEADLKVVGKDFVKVTGEFFEVLKEEITESLQTAINSRIQQLANTKVEVKKLRSSRAFVSRFQNYKIVFPKIEHVKELNLDQLLSTYSGHVNLVGYVRHFERDEGGVAFRISSEINVFKKFPVSQRNILKDEIIRAEDLTSDWVEVKKYDRDYFTQDKFIVGKKLKRNLQVGKPFKTVDLLKPLLLKRGQVVKLFIKRDNLTVTGRARVVKNAARGQKVEVENLTTRKRMTATAIDSQTVVVKF